jgi:hypothetical protein
MSEKITTCGYSDDGKMQIFELDEGEKLPKGWHDAPKPEHHPNHPDFGKAGKVGSVKAPEPPKAPEPDEPDEPPKIRRKR